MQEGRQALFTYMTFRRYK